MSTPPFGKSSESRVSTLAAPVSTECAVESSPEHQLTFYKRTLPNPPCIDFSSVEGDEFPQCEDFLHCTSAVRWSWLAALSRRFIVSGNPRLHAAMAMEYMQACSGDLHGDLQLMFDIHVNFAMCCAGKQVFQEALIAGHMNGFFKLIQQFTTQAEPAFCGISSLVQVMNALDVDPKRTWKGVWRWYSEDMLDCCKPLDEIKKVR
jgi:hypothetical protein